VTGAGRGIGRATALKLARLGAAVVVNDIGTAHDGEGRDASLAENVADEIRAAGGRAAANADSVAEFESAGRIIGTARDEFGGIDILVNNAGLSSNEPIWEVAPETFARVVASHLDGTFYCTRHAVTSMKEQGWGRIVNLISRGGITGIVGQTSYGAGKGGMFGLTNVWARDLAPFGITVNGVNPSSTETRMVMRAVEAGRAKGGEAARQAEGLMAVLQKPEQVAVVIAALCMDAASAVNGEVFLVKGNEIGLFQPLTVTQTASSDAEWQAGDLAQALAKLELHSIDGPY
jgi:NAD(P)-dependent dehydrogenase (short-subunit alcohol dehydrogenase family)